MTNHFQSVKLISEVKTEVIIMKNFWEISSFSPFTKLYAYVDHNSYLADSIFAQNKVSMKFKKEMTKRDSQFCIIFCKVPKRDIERFEESLAKLKDKMILLGYNDYDGVCNEIGKLIGESGKVK